MSIAVAQRSPVSEGRWRAAGGRVDATGAASTRGAVVVLMVIASRNAPVGGTDAAQTRERYRFVMKRCLRAAGA
jgi:hypothetical protein